MKRFLFPSVSSFSLWISHQPVHDKQIRRVHTERFAIIQRLLGIFLLSKSHKIPIP